MRERKSGIRERNTMRDRAGVTELSNSEERERSREIGRVRGIRAIRRERDRK